MVQLVSSAFTFVGIVAMMIVLSPTLLHLRLFSYNYAYYRIADRQKIEKIL